MTTKNTRNSGDLPEGIFNKLAEFMDGHLHLEEVPAKKSNAKTQMRRMITKRRKQKHK